MFVYMPPCLPASGLTDELIHVRACTRTYEPTHVPTYVLIYMLTYLLAFLLTFLRHLLT